jgi:hypothetical protein
MALPVVWQDASVPWTEFDLVLLRSMWDYHLHLDVFLQWVDPVGWRTRLRNSPSLVRWSAMKTHLDDPPRRPMMCLRWCFVRQ